MSKEVRITGEQMVDDCNSYLKYCYEWVTEELKPTLDSLRKVDSSEWDNVALEMAQELCHNCFFLNLTPQQLRARQLSQEELDRITDLLLQHLEENENQNDNGLPDLVMNFQDCNPDLIREFIYMLAKLKRMTYEETVHALRYIMFKNEIS